ncbi:MAG TPA: NADH-quinone oxidoreductase subunit H [Mycobacteriales bacterium]|jgi:formate hydrogenlyase subunit 4|nr:NADH-quinone oxidoreductase subunit H [Mycobacteriales bacterium]HVX69064.1 NADH-quinone oxidoreductase subunit H [Mycobacteriales bacterium]
MSRAADVGTATQIVLAVAVAPMLVGVTRQTRARLEGRAGAGWRQPYRDLRKLLRKQSLRPRGTTIVFAAAPLLVAASTLAAAGLVPIVVASPTTTRIGDLFVVVGLLLFGTVTLALAGLDSGTAFGGMGASRTITMAALVEPSLLLAVFALSVPVRSTSLAAIVTSVAAHPETVARPGAVLAGAALVVAVLAETGRLPIDNPATHLELTMVHEAMTLEYAGPRLAVIEWASALRLTVLLALLANLFWPAGIAIHNVSAPALLLATVAITAKLVVLAAVLGGAEVLLAKLRLFRVPELLAGAFLLGLLAVTTSSVLSVNAS